jgi:cytochrome P450
VRWVLRPLPLLERCRERYGDVFTLRIHGEAPWVVLADPAAVKEVFTGDAEVLRAGVANVILRPVVGHRSVIVLDGQEHLAQRRLLLPPFHGERMERYGRLVREIADTEIASWPRNEPLRMAPRMRALTLEVILRAVFGVRETDRLDALRPALRSALELTVSPFALFFFLVAGPERTEREARLRRALDRVDRLLFEEVARRRVAGDLAERDDVLSLLCRRATTTGAR